MDAFFTPDVLSNFGTTILIITMFWWRFGKLETKVQNQNGRIGDLEQWQAERAGYRRALEDVEDGAS